MQNLPLSEDMRNLLTQMLDNCQTEFTKINLQGHGDPAFGDIIDLTKEPNDFSEKWAWHYWKDMTIFHSRNKDRLERALRSNLEEIAEDALESIAANRLAKCPTCNTYVSFVQIGDTLVAIESCQHSVAT